MQSQPLATPTRLPRFRRAAAPPAFRLTDDDVEIVRQLARHRFLRSTHVAALVGRSLDRTNDRLKELFITAILTALALNSIACPRRGWRTSCTRSPTAARAS